MWEGRRERTSVQELSRPVEPLYPEKVPGSQDPLPSLDSYPPVLKPRSGPKSGRKRRLGESMKTPQKVSSGGTEGGGVGGEGNRRTPEGKEDGGGDPLPLGSSPSLGRRPYLIRPQGPLQSRVPRGRERTPDLPVLSRGGSVEAGEHGPSRTRTKRSGVWRARCRVRSCPHPSSVDSPPASSGRPGTPVPPRVGRDYRGSLSRDPLASSSTLTDETLSTRRDRALPLVSDD